MRHCTFHTLKTESSTNFYSLNIFVFDMYCVNINTLLLIELYSLGPSLLTFPVNTSHHKVHHWTLVPSGSTTLIIDRVAPSLKKRNRGISVLSGTSSLNSHPVRYFNVGLLLHPVEHVKAYIISFIQCRPILGYHLHF